MVSPNDLPGFWIFVYRASPLTYLIDGLISAGLANTHIICSATELLVIDPPGGFNGTCEAYLAPYARATGGAGALLNPNATLGCEYCRIASTNILLGDGLGISAATRWKNIGYLAVFIVFNILATFGVYWLARIPRKRR